MIPGPIGDAYLDSLQARGRMCFTTASAIKAHGGNAIAARAVLRRLKRQGRIATPQRGFNVIVPPEYRHLGCLPPGHFVHELMGYLQLDYYVGLLSAAELHGAAHQRPQIFQVVVEKARRPIVCGKVRIHFIARHNVAEVPIVQRNTATGTTRVASPEGTAFDIVGYPERSGGLNNSATVLTELAEQLSARALAKIAPLSPISWSQRLGYLLELLGHPKLAAPLEKYVKAKTVTPASLVSHLPAESAPLDQRWILIVNDTVEPDL